MLEQVLWAQGVPLLIVLLTSGLLAFGVGKSAAKWLLVSIAIAYFTGHYFLLGLPAFLPISNQEAILSLLMVGLFWGGVREPLQIKSTGLYVVARLITVLALIFVTRPLWTPLAHMGSLPYLFALVAIALTIGWIYYSLSWIYWRSGNLTAISPFIVMMTGLSVVTLLKGSASVAQLYGTLCAVCGAIAAVWLLRPKFFEIQWLLPALSLYGGASFLTSYYYVEVDWKICLMLLASLLSGALLFNSKVKKSPVLVQTILVTVMASLIVAAAVVLTAQANPPSGY